MTRQIDRITSERRARLMAPPWPISIRHANGARTIATTGDGRMRGETLSCEAGDACPECSEMVD